METREILLKADKVTVTFERLEDGKIRVTTTSWDDAKVILPNQVLEAAIIGKQVGLVRVDKPVAYLESTIRAWLKRVTARRCDVLHWDAHCNIGRGDAVSWA
jgi:hypothetical protein